MGSPQLREESEEAQDKSATAHPSSPQLRTTNEKGNFVCPDSSQTTRLYYQHKPSLAAVKSSAQQGCEFCTQLDFVASSGEDFVAGDTNTTFEGVWLSFDPARNRYGPGPEALTLSFQNQVLYVFCSSPTPEVERIFFGDIDRNNDIDTGSSNNISLARNWYNGCSGSHLRCSASTSDELPSRVINVGNHGDQNLRVESGGQNDEPYAALSHCWGEWGAREGLKLTAATEGLLRQGFDLSKMPLTWQHAVSVTRQLGLQYLWIDSLCILQDSAQDWEAEAAKMGSYYGKASLTIAAYSAPDGRAGLYSKRDPLTVKPCRLNLQVPREGRSYPVYAYIGRSEPGLSDKYPFDGAPLERRGWCFQEMVLSPRVLKFGPYQISWACRKYEASELWPVPRDRIDKYHMVQCLLTETAIIDGKFKSCDHAPSDTCDGYASVTGVWYSLVQRYSILELTYETDRLPALSGVAALVHKRLGGNYLAGLWPSDLILGILWRAVDYIPRNTMPPLQISNRSRYRPDPALAPSWSWASMVLNRAQITFAYQNERSINPSVDCIADSIAATVRNSSMNPYGQVQNGVLSIRSMARPGIAQQYDIGSSDYFYSHNLIDKTTNKIIGRADFDETVWPTMGFQYVPIAYFPEPDRTVGLLLLPHNPLSAGIAAQVPAQYRRIGRFHIKGSWPFCTDEMSRLIIV